jgi:hypothetical protein
MECCFVLFLLVALLAGTVDSAAAKQQAKKSKKDPNDNPGNTPFFLQDPYDQTCLGPNGFTVCDERSLWILTKRAGTKTYSLVSLLNPSTHGMCLERKSGFLGLFGGDKIGMGPCSKKGSKVWEFSFVDNKHVKLSSQGQCLVRGKKTYKNSVSVQNCKKGEFLPLLYHPTSVHENGFYLKSADEKCFDGEKFRSCEGTGASRLLWGIGIKFIWGNAQRYFFGFQAQDRNNCIVAHGNKLEKGSCSSSGALKWGLSDGKLSVDNGKRCVSRLVDNTAVLTRCSDSSEYISMDIPTVYTSEDLQRMMQNPVSI